MIDLQQLTRLNIGLPFDGSDVENINSAFIGQLYADIAAGIIGEDEISFPDLMNIMAGLPAATSGIAKLRGPRDEEVVHNYFLIRSVLQGDPKGVLKSVQNGANVNAACYMNENARYFPLVQAAIVGSLEIVKLLVEAGADVNQKQMNGETALANAVNVTSENHLRIARFLLERGADPNVIAHHELTPLAAADNSRVVKLLLDHGADPNIPHIKGDLPIAERIVHRDWGSVSLLVRAGSDLDHRNNRGVSARDRARELGLDLEEQVVPGETSEPEANCGDAQWLLTLLLGDAAYRGDAAEVRALLAGGADPNADSYLYYPSLYGHYEVVRLLLNAGANPNRRISTRLFPLYVAAEGGHIRIVQELINSGAEIDLTTPSGATALRNAVEEGHHNVVRLLLEHGASARQTSKNGSTALGYAMRYGDESMVALLRRYGAKQAGAAAEAPTSESLVYKLARFFSSRLR